MAANDKETNETILAPKIVLIPHARSHPFAQRECPVTEPLKVGRPVDKKKISQNNLIFDCRVLSRNHALIWFENGKFYIKDTKSSNGTFVNECRLSPTGEESLATEMKTRDIVQFGVNVNVEKRVTHGCIIATVKLFINEKELPGPDPDIQQVMAVVQNSLVKEQEIENKLACMQEVITIAQDLAKDSMISIVKEDELLSRLEMLENQLQVYSRNNTEDELHKQLTKSFEDKHKRELTAKETIQKMIQEKIESSSKLLQLQRDYDKAEEECQKYRTLYESLKHEHSQQVSKLNDIVKSAEKQRSEEEDKNKDEREVWLASKESLQMELDMARNELEETRLRLKETSGELLEIKNSLKSQDENQHSQDSLPVTSKEKEVIEETVLLETLAPLTAVLDNNDTEKEEEKEKSKEANQEAIQLREQLGESEHKVLTLTREINTLTKAHSSLQEQLEDIKAQLADKSILEQNKSLALADMKETIEFQKNELDRLKGQIQRQQSDITDLPTDLEQCQAQLLEVKRNSETLDKRLQNREEELTTIIKNKKELEERLATVESDCQEMINQSRERESQLQNELLEVQTEAKSLTSQLHVLQDTLADATLNNSVSSSLLLPSPPPSLSNPGLLQSSSEVSLLEAPPPPDPRLRVLSIITLVSLAVALISVAIAYFF